jgi:K+-sensing histidine kinase KdpD
MHQKKPNKPFACNAYIELGKFEAAKRRFAEADKNYQLALVAIDQDKASPLYVVLLGSQSLLEILKGDLNKALNYRKEELALLEKSGALEPLARSNAAIGEIYLKIENLADAEKHFKKALSIAEKMQRNSPLGQIFKGLADVYAKRGDYKQAFYFFRRYADHQDSLSQSDRVRRIYDKATQYALDGKDKQLELEKRKLDEKERQIKEQDLQRNGLIGFAVMVVLLLITAAIGLMQNRRSSIKLKQNNSKIQDQNKIIVEKNKVLEERNSRMVQLHTEKNNIIRVVSHDLKAPLNRINGLAQLIQIDPANTPMYLKYIADVVADGTRLIQDLLDISAIENNRLVLRKTLFNLSEDLTEVVNSYAGVSAKKSIEIKLEVPSEDLLI